jgi:integrase
MLSIDKAKEEVKLYAGVGIHGSSIRLNFTYKGKRCLETLKNITLTKTNIKAAGNKRMAICHDIENGRFDYIVTFPNSKTALKLINSNDETKSIPLNIFLDKFISASKVNNRPMTHQKNNYRTDNYIRPFLGQLCMKKIKVSEIKEWINTDLAHLSNKTICEILIPIRGAFKLAKDDKLIADNPIESISNPKRERCDNADPFTREEIAEMVKTDTTRLLERDALEFAFWTGLRPSELLAVSRCDFDLEKRTLTVKRSIVGGVFASTKTDKSYRCIDLLDDAFKIIENIINKTEHFKEFRVNVLQDNNRRYDQKTLQFIFTSSKSGMFWSDSAPFNKMFVRPHCIASGVRYRGIGQARHTYGSQLVTAGVNLSWIAKQMGHKSIKMLEKHYGRWMKSEIPNMAERVSETLKLQEKDPLQIQIKKEL